MINGTFLLHGFVFTIKIKRTHRLKNILPIDFHTIVVESS